MVLTYERIFNNIYEFYGILVAGEDIIRIDLIMLTDERSFSRFFLYCAGILRLYIRLQNIPYEELKWCQRISGCLPVFSKVFDF